MLQIDPIISPWNGTGTITLHNTIHTDEYFWTIHETTDLEKVDNKIEFESYPMEQIPKGRGTVRALDGYNREQYEWLLKLWSSWYTRFLWRINTIIPVLEGTGHFQTVE